MDLERSAEQPASAVSPLIPRVLVDGGGDAWPLISRIVGARLEDMASGDVLEVVSLEPGMHADLIAWCGGTGHTLIDVQESDETTRFWIRKR